MESPYRARLAPALAASALLLVLVTLVFGQTLAFDFVSFDDDAYIVHERHVQQGVTAATIRWAFTSVEHGLWIPLVWLSFMADHLLYGLKPGGWHLTNDAFHAATCIAMFLLLYRQSASAWRSCVAAALFAVHPLRAESVAWVTERKDVLAGLFTVATVAAYAVYARRPSGGRYAVVMACFGLALASKPTVVPLPVALLLLDYWPLNRFVPPGCTRSGAITRLGCEKLPLLAMSLAVSVATIVGSTRSLAPQGMFERAARMLTGYAEYVRRMVWPLNLALRPEAPSSESAYMSIGVWELLLSAAMVIGLSFLAWRLRRRHPALLVGWGWYAVMLLPVSGLLAPGLEPRPDRFTYLPHMGLTAALVWLAAEAWRTSGGGGVAEKLEPLRPVAGLMVIAAMACLGWRQVGFWRDSRTLWERTLACDPDNAWARNSLGTALSAAGQPAEAAEQWRRAVQIAPDFALAHFNVARSMQAAGQLAEACKGYEKAIALDPSLAEAHNNLGNALIQSGRFADAFGPCREAERLQPDNPQVQFNLGVASLRTGDPQQAVARFRTAISLLPTQPSYHNKLAESLLEAGKPAEARVAAEEAVRLRPVYPAAHLNLGISLARLGRSMEAGEHLREAKRQAEVVDQPAIVTAAADAIQSMTSAPAE